LSDVQGHRPGCAILEPGSSDPAHLRELDAWLQLQAALAFEPERAAALLEREPDPGRVLARVALASPLSPSALRSIRRALVRDGVVGVPLASERYPAPLREISDPPLLLLVRGEPASLMGALVGVVGARAATVHGLETARELGGRLAEAGAVVVSGLARGIDAAAHRGALDAGGRTVAVQACGPDRVYPAEHRALAQEIADSGALVSEFPVATPPRAPYFPLRNRVISGLSSALIVVEARARSGSLITARHALDQGRDVLAVPGPIHAPTSGGPNRLIRDGATPIVDLDDFVEGLGLETPAARAPRRRTVEPPPVAGENPILDALSRGGLARDDLAQAMGRTPEQLDLDLLDLRLSGRVALDRDGRLVAVSGADSGGVRTTEEGGPSL